jgi:pilus assembly protein Flp/PilA
MSGLNGFRLVGRRAIGMLVSWVLASSQSLRADVARGQGLVEYALILVLIAVIVIGILSTLGTQTSRVFDQVNCTLSGGPTHQDNGNGNSNRCN